jgi:hypothetical protein
LFSLELLPKADELEVRFLLAAFRLVFLCLDQLSHDLLFLQHFLKLTTPRLQLCDLLCMSILELPNLFLVSVHKHLDFLVGFRPVLHIAHSLHNLLVKFLEVGLPFMGFLELQLQDLQAGVIICLIDEFGLRGGR